MSLACKCDRCQNFFSPNKQRRTTRIRVGLFSLDIDNRGPIDYKDHDLCDSCAEALDIWLNEYKKGDNENE